MEKFPYLESTMSRTVHTDDWVNPRIVKAKVIVVETYGNSTGDKNTNSWGLVRAAVCDCGTPWTFLLPFF